MRPFTEELVVEAAGVPLPLATLRGACTAGELTLASDSLPFGTVVLGSCTSKWLALSNRGDVGVRFAWDVRALAPHFSILPSGGAAGGVEVFWGPAARHCSIRLRARQFRRARRRRGLTKLPFQALECRTARHGLSIA